MSELNFKLLQENIRGLLKKHDLTQSELAEIAGMSQGNFSKALNPDEKKQFTLEQLYRIAQHFRVSMDELTGNKAAEKSSVTPRAVLAFLVELLRTDKARVTTWTHDNEEVFDVCYGADGPSCSHIYLDVEYPVIYFPSHIEFDGLYDYDTVEAQELYAEFTQCGNETAFRDMNDIIKKLLPMIELYKSKEIPEEAFQMIVDGYLKQLRDY